MQKNYFDTNGISEEFVDLMSLFDIQVPDPSTLEYYRQIRDRELYINDTIDDSLIEMSEKIIMWNKLDKGTPTKKRKPIKIFINTDGGYVEPTFNLIDIIKISKTPVITIGMGRAYSSGCLLLMAGHKRYVFRNTSCLIHDGSTGIKGDTGKVIDNLEFTKRTEQKAKEYVLSCTNISKSVYDKYYRRDWFMDSEDIIKYGIADEIIDDIEVLF